MEVFGVSGTIASIAGLAISIWLIFIAKGARKAAQEARDYVYTRNLMEDFREIENLINQIEHELQNGSKTMLQYLARQSLKRIQYFRSRWSQELLGRANVAMIIDELDNLSKHLSTCQNATLTPIEITTTEDTLTKINQYLYAEMGIFDKKFS